MPNDNVGSSRPIDLTDDQIKNMAIGKSFEVGEHSRPRALTDKDVKALSTGKDLSLENFPMLERLAGSEGRLVSESTLSRPREVTDKDVDALSAGKDSGLKE